MLDSRSPSVTAWLARLRTGESAALDHVVLLVYHELRQVARRQLQKELRTGTLSATALVHEAYLRLVQQRGLVASDRQSFLCIAAHVMRRVLLDHARRRHRLKRGGASVSHEIDRVAGRLALDDRDVEEVLAINELLDQLVLLDARAAAIVEYRIFAGLTIEEIAVELGVSSKTVQRSWAMARAWLRKEVGRRPI